MLQKYCKYEGRMYNNADVAKEGGLILDEEKLKVMGILLCKGDNTEKA